MSDAFMKGLYGIQHINDPDVKIGMKQIILDFKHRFDIPEDSKLTNTQKKELNNLLADYILEIGGKYYGRT